MGGCKATVVNVQLEFPSYGVAYYCTFLSRDKGKAIPLQAWTGPEGSRRLRLPDFKTIGTG
jgi:hypothetical protein